MQATESGRHAAKAGKKKMKIKMSAEQAAGLFEFAMLQDLDPTSMEPMKVSRDSAELKLMDGRPVLG